MSAQTTIAAIASAPGAARRGIVRLSGPQALEIAARCCAGGGGLLDAPRGLRRVRFLDGAQEQEALALVMRAPRSFTGEDCVEFHLRGAQPLLAAALARVLAAGAEPAQPGEYARRAFGNGRISLLQAEGVLSLATARNAADARAAQALLGGGLSSELDKVREALLDARALCEAALDFAEEDVAAVPRAEVEALVDAALGACRAARASVAARPRPAGLPRVVLAGAPNAGKSSLYNALLGRAAALVSPAAGTTRDPLCARASIAGVEFELVDTAGLGEARDELDRAAQELARERAAEADLGLWVADATLPLGMAPSLPEGAARILVWNQIDRAEAGPTPQGMALEAVPVSAVSGAGLPALRDAIRRCLESQLAGAGIGRDTAARHAHALDELLHELAGARDALDGGLELAAEHLARAQAALGRLGGESTPEDVLDRIFARFCLGK